MTMTSRDVIRRTIQFQNPEWHPTTWAWDLRNEMLYWTRAHTVAPRQHRGTAG